MARQVTLVLKGQRTLIAFGHGHRRRGRHPHRADCRFSRAVPGLPR
jgi:hypothetical protein